MPGPFVGRTAELEVLDAHLDQVRHGVPTVVLIDGAAGIGKTALLGRFLEDAGGVVVLWASGDEAESRLPYAVLSQFLVGLKGHPHPLLRDGVDAGSDPFEVGAKFLDLLGLEGDAPMCLVVDDAHWADAASLQALTFALRRLHQDPVLAIFTCRDDGMGLPEGLRRLAGETRIRLGGLDSREVSELAVAVGAGELSVRAAERLRQHTGGNPLYARALIEELDLNALRTPDGALPAPRSFALVTLARLATSGPEGRRLLEAMAVLDDIVPLTLAAQVGEVGDVAAALEEAVETRLLRVPTPSAVPNIAFVHPLMRAAIYRDIAPGRRANLHLRAAAHLDSPASLEHRIAGALVEDPALAAEVERQARSEISAGMHAEAAAHLRAAARLTPERWTRERLALDALEVLLDGGLVAEAAAMAGAPSGSTDSIRRGYLLGRLAFLLGRQAEAEELLMGVWERVSLEHRRLVGPVAAYLAWLYSLHMRFDLVVEWARRAIAEPGAERLPVPVRSLVMSSLGLAGRTDEALAYAATLLRDQEPTPDDVEPLLGRGVVRMWTDDLIGARADLAAAAGPPHLSGVPLVALGWLAEVEYRLGAWDDSVVHASLAVSLVRDTDQVWLAAFVHAMATWALAARGAWEQGEDHVRCASAAAATLGDAASTGYACIAAAHLAFCRGDAIGAVDAVERLLTLEGWRRVEEPGVMAWRELYADSLVALGRHQQAEEILADLAARALPRDRASSLARLARVGGKLAVARGDSTAARASFAAGLGHADKLGMPFERALIEDAYGRFLRRLGERRNAATHLEAAWRRFSSLGAKPFAERCRAELDACGLSPRERSPGADLSLTPQELAVARLVATGLTNREVAAELIVSPKTVEYHLGHVFAKFRVRSRTELAIRLAPGGAAEGSPADPAAQD